MYKYLCLYFFSFVLLLMCPVLTVQAFTGTGTGSEIDPFMVSTCTQLQSINTDALAGLTAEKVYQLTGDIDCSDTINWNDNLGFVPIGNGDYNFFGVFDGGNHKIIGLNINRPAESYQGLFGYSSGQVKNLELVGGSFMGNHHVGAIVGLNRADGIITNCSSSADLSGADSVIGGLAGANFGTISGSNSSGQVTGIVFIGGLVGENLGNIYSSYSTGDVNGTSFIGGLIGGVDTGLITSSTATGSVTGVSNVGGFAGSISGGTISNCSSTGPVAGNDAVGGFIGINAAAIDHSSATGKVTGVANNIGGFIGSNSYTSIVASYATGDVTGGGYVGGFIGNESGTIFNNIYATGNVTGTADYVGGLIGSLVSAQITGGSATGNVTGYDYVGGLVGNSDSSSMFSSHATGKINGHYRVGGLIGYLNNGEINRSYSLSSVVGNNDVGGLVGATLSGSITRSYSAGLTIVSNNIAGGLVGTNNSSISDSYSVVRVTGDAWVGGLVGYNYNETIRNSYSTGKVSGNDYVGGLVGKNRYGEGISSFWNIDTSGSNSSPAGEGKSSSQMKNGATFSDWDFDTTWEIVEGSRNPTLQGVTLAPIGQFTLTYTTDGHGSIDGNTSQLLWNDENGTAVTAVSDRGYFFLKWSDDSTSNPYFGGQPQSNTVIRAIFSNNWTKEIRTIAELQKIGNDVVYPLDGRYILAQDIDAVETVDWNDGAGFAPISDFNGTLDGNDYNIIGLTINRPNTSNIGIFAALSGEIDNLGLVDATVTGDSYTGGLVGVNSGTINNCNVAGVIKGGDYTGGLVGINSDTVKTSFATSQILSNGWAVGGLVGENDGEILNSYATGAVGSTILGYDQGTDVGGLVGWTDGGSIASSYATGNVVGDDWVGGLAGGAEIVTESYATGNVSASGVDVGGLVGESYGATTDCYATGAVSGSADGNIGGLVGNSYPDSEISNCYSTGLVTGSVSDIGGLVGYADYYEDPAASASYWDLETSGQSASSVGVGKSTTEMKSQDTYSNWNFTDTWVINAGINYPILRVFLVYYNLAYSAGDHGSLTGSISQSVLSGTNGTAVTAVAASGYRFVKWSDNVTSNPRLDTGVAGDITVTASFELIPVQAPPASGGGAIITLPAGTGAGGNDISATGIGSTVNVGAITATGVNVLTYITNTNNFTAPESSNGWNSGFHSFQITNLDLANNIATITFSSKPVTVTLKKGESKDIDLDGDGKNDIKATFANIFVNRAEITVKSLALATTVVNTTPITPVTVTKSAKFIFKKNLSSGMINNDVKELQKYLNANGFILVKTGPGSPGNETTKFGAATRIALIKFQKAKGIKPANGSFGPLTRGVVNK